MSALLERLHTIFDGMPIILTTIPVLTDPSDAHRRMLADHVAALANEHNGGVLVLGIDAEHPHRVRGVASPWRWTAAIERAAAALVPPVELEVEVGEDEGRAVVAARVPYVPVHRDLVRRADGPCVRLVGGRPVPSFRPLRDVAPARVPPMLAPVVGSTPLWLDPEATGSLAAGSPGAWSEDTRCRLAKAGLLAADGVAVTRAGLLLAGLPEHRPDGDGVVLETPGEVFELSRGWILLREDLRAEARAVGVRRADLVADLVTDVLVRTAGPTPAGPVVVDLTPELLTIEAPSPLRDDGDLAQRMKAWASWHPERWKAVSVGWHLPVRWEQDGDGVRVTAHLVRPDPRVRAIFAPPMPTQATARERAASPTAVARPATPTPTPPASSPPPATTPAADAHQPRATREAAVLALLADGRSWTRRELDARLGWSRSTMRTVLEKLVHAGRVTSEAPSPRSPFQAYRAA